MKKTKRNKDHFDLSENQDSCDNHPEESKYDENDDQVGGYRCERRGDRVVVDEVLQSSVLCTDDEVHLVNLNMTNEEFVFSYLLPRLCSSKNYFTSMNRLSIEILAPETKAR